MNPITYKSETAGKILLLIALALGGVLSYFLLPAYEHTLGRHTPLWQPDPEIGTLIIVSCISAMIPILIGAGVSFGILFKSKRTFAGIGIVQVVAMLYTVLVLGNNLLDWKTHPEIVMYENNTAYSPEEYEAGEAYLKLVTNKDATIQEFEKTITPLIEVEKWGFTPFHPLLTYHGSMRKKSENTWEYLLPLGNIKDLSEDWLKMAGEDMKAGKTKEAGKKAELILAIGNRLAQPKDLTQMLVASHLSDKAVNFLGENPSIEITPSLKKELDKLEDNPKKFEIAYQEEFKIILKRIEEITRPNGKLYPAAAVTNPKNFEKSKKAFVEEMRKETQDWNKLVTNAKWKALLKNGPIQWMLINISFPPGNGVKASKELVQKARALLNA
jgi:hypothetical protein